MTTEQLYDKGEENWQTKLHVGCGGIRLVGYTNIDIDGLPASSFPEEAKANETGITDYYARLEGDMCHLPAPRATYYDLLGDMRFLPYEANSVDKMVAIQCLEHLTVDDAILTLYDWFGMLRPGGTLILSVPDMDETLEMIHTEPELAYRHLRGAKKSVWSQHQSWYTKRSLIQMLSNHSRVASVVELDNFHFYPAIVLRITKASDEDNILPDGL